MRFVLGHDIRGAKARRETQGDRAVEPARVVVFEKIDDGMGDDSISGGGHVRIAVAIKVGGREARRSDMLVKECLPPIVPIRRIARLVLGKADGVIRRNDGCQAREIIVESSDSLECRIGRPRQIIASVIGKLRREPRLIHAGALPVQQIVRKGGDLPAGIGDGGDIAGHVVDKGLEGSK